MLSGSNSVLCLVEQDETMIDAGSPKRDGGSGQQAVADLRINNEALLCMLERERQHSHQLQQRLQQVEADALEVG